MCSSFKLFLSQNNEEALKAYINEIKLNEKGDKK